MKAVKFGGSSLATAENILRAKKIVESDPERTFVVVSAPGKSAQFPRKVTDLLIDAHARLCYSNSFDICETVLERFSDLARELGVDISAEIARTREEILVNKCDYDFIISRGEYLTAVLFARLVGYNFLDAANYVVIKGNGAFDEGATCANFAKLPRAGAYVMGGFYGRSPHNIKIKTFKRGGSDYSGAIAAVCLGARVYENFTDTHGVQTANPAAVKDTMNIPEIDYATLYKLCRGGASVIYPNCVPLLKRHAMPLKVDCTYHAGEKYTLVGAKRVRNPYFSITYETKRNINKDTVEILCVMNKINFPYEALRAVLGEREVYLISFSRREFRLIAPVADCVEIINLLHKSLTAAKSTAPV